VFLLITIKLYSSSPINMKSSLALLALFSFVLASVPSTMPHLDPSVPIYLGEIFWPPSMTFIAWLPTSIQNPLEYCWKATEAYEGKLFSLNGVDALEVKDYFSEHAYITREGKRFAQCYITPESVRMGSCQGAKDWDCEGGHKYTGPGTRKWTCWIRQQERGRNGTDGRSVRADGIGEKLTDADFRPTSAKTGVLATAPIMGAFTPAVTGM
jgi:hypothetical protein